MEGTSERCRKPIGRVVDVPVEEVEKLGAEVEIDALVVKCGPLGQSKILVLAGEGPRVVKRARKASRRRKYLSRSKRRPIAMAMRNPVPRRMIAAIARTSPITFPAKNGIVLRTSQLL